MTEVRGNQIREVDAETIALLAQHRRWTKFEEGLDAADRVLLDCMCVGHDLKVAAAKAKLAYDCASKRLAIHRDRLRLRSSAQLLALWHKMHAHKPHIDQDTPTLIRHADRIASISTRSDLQKAAS